jgi:hypothetical protein
MQGRALKPVQCRKPRTATRQKPFETMSNQQKLSNQKAQEQTRGYRGGHCCNKRWTDQKQRQRSTGARGTALLTESCDAVASLADDRAANVDSAHSVDYHRPLGFGFSGTSALLRWHRPAGQYVAYRKIVAISKKYSSRLPTKSNGIRALIFIGWAKAG